MPKEGKCAMFLRHLSKFVLRAVRHSSSIAFLRVYLFKMEASRVAVDEPGAVMYSGRADGPSAFVLILRRSLSLPQPMNRVRRGTGDHKSSESHPFTFSSSIGEGDLVAAGAMCAVSPVLPRRRRRGSLRVRAAVRARGRARKTVNDDELR